MPTFSRPAAVAFALSTLDIPRRHSVFDRQGAATRLDLLLNPVNPEDGLRILPLGELALACCYAHADPCAPP
jgi:hypothetical protein